MVNREDELQRRALEAGRQTFGASWRPLFLASAPGRIELLGNHLDYNGGQVLAAAIDRSIVALFDTGGSPGQTDVVFADRGSTLDSISHHELNDWRNSKGRLESADYVRGALATALTQGRAVRSGVRLTIAGDVPIGFGISSSAALCVALSTALNASPLSKKEIVLAAQEAEHRAGTPCGTMDQSASVHGDVILFDGATLDVEPLTPDLTGYVFAVADSGVSRSLASSSYGERVRECEAARAEASSILGRELPSLAIVSTADLPVLERSHLSTLLFRRVRHIVTESVRVQHGIDAMAMSDWKAFGALMNASGRSSALDYEISHPRVEELVTEAQAVEGVLGARMMGGGEGGTALILAERDAIPRLTDALHTGYYRRYPIDARHDALAVVHFAPGARLEPWSATTAQA